jgi:cell division protease FtsH
MTRPGDIRTGSGRVSSAGADRARRTMVRRLLRRLDACRAAASECKSRTEILEKFGPEVVGATILLATELALHDGLERTIRNSAPVVIVEVPHADWVEPMARSLAAVFGSDAERRDPKDVGMSRPRNVPVVVAPGNRGRHHDSENTSRTSWAIREHRALIGVTGTAFPALPDELLRACDERLVVRKFDSDAVELLLEHIVGTVPEGRLSEDDASEIEPMDLRIAIHPARGAKGALDRLSAVLGRRLRRTRSSDVPLLQDLAGYGAAHGWGLAAAADLAAYARKAIPWSACEPAVLLAGPPGTGKTSFAAALARQAAVPCLAGSLAQWQSESEAHLGTTLKAMRAFFEAAGKAAPCVALIDELDSFGDRRNFTSYAREYWTQLVNGLLECLDGAGGRAGILLVGTTNHRNRIDPAILRAGRFDRCITIELPTISELAVILRHHLGPDLADADLTEAARRAMGGTGADCAAWVRRARGRARRADRVVLLADLLIEIDATDTPPNQADDLRAAVHEGGHALVAHVLGLELCAVSLHATGESRAATGIRMHKTFPTRTDLRDLLAVYLAGRAAEQVVLSEASAGSASDLVEATELCGHMHCRWGLEDRLTVCSMERMPDGVAIAVEEDLRQASNVATTILRKHRADLDRLVEALIARRALDGAEITATIGPIEPQSGCNSTSLGVVPSSVVQVDADGAAADVDLQGAEWRGEGPCRS